MQTRPLDVHDDTALRRFHQILWRAEKEDGRPWNPTWSFEEMAAILREPTSERRTVGVAAHDDSGAMVGGGFVMLPLLDNRDTAWVFAAVEPELRCRGIGTSVMDALLVVARAERRTQLLAAAGIPFEERKTSPILRWAQRQGFTTANTEIQRNLDLPVPAGLLDELAEEAARKHGGYEIRSFLRPVPDELLASWCDLSNTFMLDAPMGDVDVEAGALTPEAVRERDAVDAKIGRTVYSTVALKDGVVVAHTDLGVPGEADEAHQWVTLVHREHRGHRLGAAVKVANLRALQAGHPRLPRVVTTNAETNAWMVAINDRLGFRPVAVVPTLKRRLYAE